MSTRLIQISDEQLKMCLRGLSMIPPVLLTPEDNYELGMLAGMIQETVLGPEDPKLLHGYTL
jgi:hypothetical protein